MVRTFAEALMSAEADDVCGAGCGQVSDERVNRRNWYRDPNWDARVGTIELAYRSCGRTATLPNGCCSRAGARSRRSHR